MRDIQTFELNEKEWLVAAADNAGAIGERELDQVKAPIEVTASLTLRVALMECMSVKAVPFSVLIHNFMGDEAWGRIEKACLHLLKEARAEGAAIAGSTESNMEMVQSALGITVLGKVRKKDYQAGCTPPDAAIAVIGEPLVGSEVLEKKDRMIPLSLFMKLVSHPGVYEMIPAGSKGIAHEALILNPQARLINGGLDLYKSCGPASCAVISYKKKDEQELKNLAKDLFYSVSAAE
ncbi:ATPase [Bacillus sp. FJAT-42376]|uniref:ATPase n=1 Tax=Bacillus sp. FJAT-42376 TaxID=2014076 RepID=UPI000F4EC3ED|nr:ATPase [Bacillus sp. FJAT-42376]AZB42683.1 ATPase [Bacillus sp. FJAT-42376]